MAFKKVVDKSLEDMNFGERVRYEMKGRKITVDEAAKTAGKQSSNWSRMLNDSPETPQNSTVKAVAKVLQLPETEVWKWAHPVTVDIPIEQYVAECLTPELMRVDPEKRKKIIEELTSCARALVNISLFATQE